MREDRFRTPLPLIVLVGPWLVGQSFRHSHALLLAGLFLSLASFTILRDRKRKPERLALLPLLAALWPSALVAAPAGVLGVGRLGLVAGTSALLVITVLARMIMARRMLPASERSLSCLLIAALPEAVPLAKTELALFWFGLFRWRRNAGDAPADAVRFPSTASGIEIAMCLLNAVGLLIETPLLHVLLAHVSGKIVAWSCTGLHVLLGIYLIGYAKSLLFRPTLLFADRLEIRLGVLARRVVPRASIEALSAHDRGKDLEASDQRLFGLDAPNMGLSTGRARILFRVDEPTRLMQALAA